MPEWTDRAVQTETDRDHLILEHIPLLKHIVGRMWLDVPGGMDREDLYGHGMVGLVMAADSWEKSRGLKFSTYAYTKIRGAILDELRRTDFLPRGRRERVRELEAAIHRCEQERGVPPTPEELANELGVDLGEIDRILLSAASANQTSLNDGPSEQLGALLSDPKSTDPVGSAEWTEMRGVLADTIAELPDSEQTVITLYYAEELLLRDIAEILGVTESRVSQIHSRAIYRLNRVLTSMTGTTEA
ncbi:MAG: FliA/WhiG family RNA polymerase sigma factor [bacterium]|nr:FliA/WhiG family RNA polymerase sigma factor [bacterium]